MAKGRIPQQLFRENLIQRFNDPDLQDFVQSTVNILSDKIDIDDHHGLKLEARGTSKKLISFFEKIKSKSPLWDISFDDGNTKGLNISEGEESRLFIKKGGNVGIGTTSPKFKLQVEGVVAMRGRVGDFVSGSVPADGDWHAVLKNLDGCQGFEALAHINHSTDGRFALTHAVLLMSDSKGSRNQVKSVDAASSWLWGRFLNKIKFRWVEDKESSQQGGIRYRLEIRSRTRYGVPGSETANIYYRLMKLWDKNYEDTGRGYTSAGGESITTTIADQVDQHRIKPKIKIGGR